MNSDRIRFVVEVVGIVAIVASLIFVGLQMRQTHEIALVTLMQMRSDAGRELAAAQLGSEPLYAINAKVSAGEELTAYEALTLSLQPFLFFNQFENSHFLYLQGYITEEQWQSDLAAIRHYATIQPGYQAYWDEHRHIFRSSYAAEIDRALSDRAP
jgi:hypothetical protein